ncbi:MAG: cytochrome b/b6 domain-containing protein [Formivibrio sp.]|nr:cytochrome b/b6 domain-containing protein [Formivibrio sp.]
MKKIRVWDPLVRLLHWVLVGCVISNLFNASGHFAHRTLGLIAAGAVTVRLVWGFVGPQYARFSDWFPTPTRLIPYLRALLRNQAPRHLGHNPAAAVMMLTLMALVLGLGVSGYLMTTDAFYENETLQGVHESLVSILQAAVIVHVLAALYESWKHRENLIGSMVHGYKPVDTGFKPENEKKTP